MNSKMNDYSYILEHIDEFSYDMGLMEDALCYRIYNTHLAISIENNNISKIKQLLDNGVDINLGRICVFELSGMISGHYHPVLMMMKKISLHNNIFPLIMEMLSNNRLILNKFEKDIMMYESVCLANMELTTWCLNSGISAHLNGCMGQVPLIYVALSHGYMENGNLDKYLDIIDLLLKSGADKDYCWTYDSKFYGNWLEHFRNNFTQTDVNDIITKIQSRL